MITEFDKQMLRRAIDLARRGEGYVEPNPMVGAVVVRAGQVIGEGWHELFGGPHAEVNALISAGNAARGSDLYVTLEPCCHYGKTPPCTGAVISAGIRRVVVAASDPNPSVAGKGLAKLRESGVSVEVGGLEADGRELIAPYVKLLKTGRPWVIAKWAMSLDGRIATKTGDSKWITGPEARAMAHELRGRVDAIIVGVNTVLKDDSLLTARPPGPRVATRIVLDSKLKTPAAAQIVVTATETPTIFGVSEEAPVERVDEIQASGCEVLTLPIVDSGLSLPDLLTELGRRKMTNVMIEGGGQVLGSFFDERLVDEVRVFVAPKVIGGGAALSPVMGGGIALVRDSLHLGHCSNEFVGDDWMIQCRVG